MLRIFAFILTLMIGSNAMAGETVTYKDGDTTMEGYLARADKPGAPVVLVFHQWMGLTDHEKQRADMLAAAGYNAIAVDMYGQGVKPKDQSEAGTLATKYKSDVKLAHRRIQAAVDYAKLLEGVDTARIAAIGFCFGGTMALELARMGLDDVKSVVSFHGALATPAPVTTPGAVKAAISIQHGAADPMVPPAEVKAFTEEMNAAKADWFFTEYAYAVHAFTQVDAGNDPAKGVAYNEKADKRSWAAMLAFFAETLAAPRMAAR